MNNAEDTFLATKVLMVASLIFITIGSALCWAHTGSVTTDANAQKAANYYIIGFFYIWVVSVVILWSRKYSRAASSALYFLSAGLVFEICTRNQIISWGYANLWRIYTQNPTRLSYHPSDYEKESVKSMLAGAILGHFGVVCCVVGSVLRTDLVLSIRGTYMSLLGWLLAVPGAICLFNSHSATLETTQANTAVYQSTWQILDAALAIMTVQTTGILFDNYEYVAAAAVISGTHGLFLLGDTFMLQYQRGLESTFDGDGPIVYAGGILCWLSIFVSLIGALYFFDKRHIIYMHEAPTTPASKRM